MISMMFLLGSFGSCPPHSHRWEVNKRAKFECQKRPFFRNFWGKYRKDRVGVSFFPGLAGKVTLLKDFGPSCSWLGGSKRGGPKQ